MTIDEPIAVPIFALTRRGFAITSLAAGFAAAVQPVSAETITTDAKGLIAGEVQIPVSDGQVPAYRAMPEGKGRFPVILVVQEVFGVHEHIKDICRRFAKLGHLAIAPALYARQGDPAQLPDIPSLIALVAKVPDAQVMSDLDATVKWTKSNGGDASRLAVTGFCWGGRITWLYAAHNHDVKAGVAWYGTLTSAKKDELHPEHPLDLVSNIKAPILGLYGGQDQGIPQDTVEAMRAALKAAGSKSEIIVYPDAPHGFNADYRPSYRPDAAKDGWDKANAWFKKYGAA